jgi:hypothetical protein
LILFVTPLITSHPARSTTPRTQEMEEALSANLKLLGFDPAAAAARGAHVSTNAFRKPNTKGLEELLYFLLTALDARNASVAFYGLWPVHDAPQVGLPLHSRGGGSGWLRRGPCWLS